MKIAPRFLAFGPIACSYAESSRSGFSSPRHASSQRRKYPALAASGLAAALQDQKSYAGYLRRCEEAWRGELNPDRLLSAYEQAMGPKARNRGAIFMVAVRQKE